MLSNYFKIAWRNLLKNKFYAIINIIGLSTGLTVGILILLWVQSELSYDRFHRNAGNIYRVLSNIGGNGTLISAASYAPLATFAKREIPEIKNAVRIRGNWEFPLFQYKNNRFTKEKKCYVDPTFFTVFDFKLLQGDPRNPFDGDYSVILTSETAKRFFGSENPIGKIVKSKNEENFIVSGVVEDFPENSSIHYDMLFPMSLYARIFPGNGHWKSIEDDWGNSNFTTFLELYPGALKSMVEKKLALSPRKNYQEIGFHDDFRLQPLTDIHLYNVDGSEAGMKTVRVFLIICVSILIIACINYVNLSTARSLLRTKEVSIRKIIGARKNQLFAQFVVETTLIFFLAIILSIVLGLLIMPLYNSISGKNIAFSLHNSEIWTLIGITVLSCLTLSSIYPAILLSSIKPIQVLTGKLFAGFSAVFFRKILVTIQFVFSAVLITSTLIINRQLNYIHNKELGYNKENVFSFGMRDLSNYAESFKEELLKQSGIKGASFASDQIVNIGSSTSDVDWEGKVPGQDYFIHIMSIDADFLSLFKLSLKQGNGFNGFASDSTHYILNETAVRKAGIVNPIGKRLTLFGVTGTIVGVVKDFHFASLKQKIEPAIFTYQSINRQIYVKTTGKDVQKAIASAEKIWKQHNSIYPFEYTFLDETFDNLYKVEERTGALSNLFSIVAIVISCLGLLGLSTYTAETKTKEIGIRKVMGASIADILRLLTMDFLWLVIIAIAIAIPISWISISQWMSDFAYSVTIRWWMFVAVGIFIVVIAFLTVCIQFIRAASFNPLKNLRPD